jgi:NAD(P)-dependent dehydrogenase (short-subunit alcohol dehydrogenase family)
MSLKNNRVLIIGGTSGIGLGVAVAVAERGGTPIVVSRRQSSVDRALAGLPDGARGTTVDLADAASLSALADEVGAIDHLVFTAGESLEQAKLADLTAEAIVGFLQTRFIGALLSARTFAPLIRAGGSITLTTGVAGDRPGLGVLPSAVCGAMNAATKALAVELAPLRVNAVSPGPILTPLWGTEAEQQALHEQFTQRVPLGRVGEVADTALAYVYAMEQTYGTGTLLTVDGGMLLA